MAHGKVARCSCCKKAVATVTYPPAWMKDGEAQVVHNPVAVAVAVAIDLNSDREAFDAQVKVRAICTLNANIV